MTEKTKYDTDIFKLIIFATGMAIGMGIFIIVTLIYKGAECIA